MTRTLSLTIACAALVSIAPAAFAQAPPPGPMTFFVTSIGPGRGGDLGGLAGADAHCQALALAAGFGGRNWRAYSDDPLAAIDLEIAALAAAELDR